MTWDEEAQAYVLASGKRLPVDSGILGISPAAAPGSAPGIWAGGDCTVVVRDLSTDDRQDIASHMISLWAEWAGHV